jgi:diaminopimelate decarboxylase
MLLSFYLTFSIYRGSQMQTLSFSQEAIKNVSGIAETFGTPFYLYDGECLKENYNTLKRCLPEFVDVFYALKVNPNVSLCSLLRSQGANAEVCSLAELEISIKAGFLPKDIIFLGPGKNEREIRRALELDIFALVIESREELKRASEIAEELGKIANVAIRINPNFAADAAPLKMGGRPTHFGLTQDEVMRDFSQLADTPNIHIRGLHVYNGSRILEAKAVYENTQNILNLFRQISEQHNYHFDMVDVGGGMGVPYFEKETPLDSLDMERLMKPLFNEFREKYPDVRIIMESGRYIAATSALFVTRVNSIKESHGKKFAICDGGTNCHLSAVGLDSVVKRNFPIFNLSNRDQTVTDCYQVAGPLCNPDDLLARKVDLPVISVSDLLAVSASGAYGPTASPTLFHSQGYPAEVLIESGETYLIRKRDQPEDIIERHVFVDFCVQEGPSSFSLHSPSDETTHVKKSVVEALRKVLSISTTTVVNSSSRLRADLGLDSISAMELLIELEDEIHGFRVNSNTLEAKHFRDVLSITQYISSEIGLNQLQPQLNARAHQKKLFSDEEEPTIAFDKTYEPLLTA